MANTLDCIKFRENLNILIQTSNLSVGSAYYIMKDCFHDLELMFIKQVQIEIDETKQENEESKNEEATEQ